MAMSISQEAERLCDLETRGESLDFSVEALQFQVSAAEVPPQLEITKAILLSIIHTLRPDQTGKEELIFSFVEYIVNLSMDFFTVVEMAEDAPQLMLDNIAKFHHALEDVEVFLVAATRRKPYLCSSITLRKVIDTKCRAFDQRLVSILDGFGTALCAHLETGASMTASSDQCNNIASSNLFSDANDFTINNSQFFSVPGGSISFNMEATNLLEGLQPGKDLELVQEVYKAGEYRLHRGRARGKAVVVKVFQGPRAKQLCIRTAEFNQNVMHSNVLRMIEGPSRDSETSFIVFDGDYQGTVESQLAISLRNGIREGIVMGANTIIACSAPKQLGLDYLQELGLPFPIMGPQHFVLMVSKEGGIVIDFDADATWNAARNDESGHLAISQYEKATEVCNGLIQKTFYTSCKEYYQSQRSYIDEAVDEDEALFEDDSSFDELEDEAKPSLTGSGKEALAGGAPSRNPLRKSKGHRRELVWKSETATLASLEEIGRCYQTSLLQFRSEIVLNHRRGHTMTQTAHRCPGYRRTEIILTPDIGQSGIVSHTSPIPNEICSVCGENVGNAEIFDCSCGLPNDDTDNSLPTIKCTVCSRWQHQTCMKIPPETQMKNFICWRCPGRSIPVDPIYPILPFSSEVSILHSDFEPELPSNSRVPHIGKLNGFASASTTSSATVHQQQSSHTPAPLHTQRLQTPRPPPASHYYSSSHYDVQTVTPSTPPRYAPTPAPPSLGSLNYKPPPATPNPAVPHKPRRLSTPSAPKMIARNISEEKTEAHERWLPPPIDPATSLKKEKQKATSRVSSIPPWYASVPAPSLLGDLKYKSPTAAPNLVVPPKPRRLGMPSPPKMMQRSTSEEKAEAHERWLPPPIMHVNDHIFPNNFDPIALLKKEKQKVTPPGSGIPPVYASTPAPPSPDSLNSRSPAAAPIPMQPPKPRRRPPPKMMAKSTSEEAEVHERWLPTTQHNDDYAVPRHSGAAASLEKEWQRLGYTSTTAKSAGVRPPSKMV